MAKKRHMSNWALARKKKLIMSTKYDYSKGKMMNKSGIIIYN